MEPSALVSIALFLLAAGLMSLLAAGYLFFQSRPFQQGVECRGTVIDLSTRPGEDDSEGQAPIVRFIAQNGQEFTFTGAVYSYPPAYKIGQTVTVVYPPNQPEQARIRSEGRLLLIIFAILGFILTCSGLWFGLSAVWAAG
ncbi:MAG: DUF3592 domain-containing protein [Roseiflexaceae bacterium]|nr:DUF3592 domain-containing protein [Roseiflexaceae bacterium]